MYPFKLSIVRFSISSPSNIFSTPRMKCQHKKNNQTHFFLSSLESSDLVIMFANLRRRWSWQYHHRAHRVCAADNLPSSPRRRRQSRLAYIQEKFLEPPSAKSSSTTTTKTNKLNARFFEETTEEQRENIYTMPDIGTTPYQMKDDLPAKGPEFDLSQKATATVFRRTTRTKRRQQKLTCRQQCSTN